MSTNGTQIEMGIPGRKLGAQDAMEHQQSCAQESCATDLSRVNVGDLERAVSVIAGGAMIILSPPRSIRGCLMTLAGMGLMYRAMTGHCFVYQSLDINTAD